LNRIGYLWCAEPVRRRPIAGLTVLDVEAPHGSSGSELLRL